VSGEDIKITVEDYHLLGQIVQRSRSKTLSISQEPLYGNEQAERLRRGGYLRLHASITSSGKRTYKYVLTKKGRDAWLAYRLSRP
jgi:hypothetical protein